MDWKGIAEAFALYGTSVALAGIADSIGQVRAGTTVALLTIAAAGFVVGLDAALSKDD